MRAIPLIMFFLAIGSTAFAADLPELDEKSIGVVLYAKIPFEDGSMLLNRKVKHPKTPGVCVVPLPYSPGVGLIPEFSVITHVDDKPVASAEELNAAINTAADKVTLKFLKSPKARGPIDWSLKSQATIPVGTLRSNAKNAVTVSDDKVTGKTWVRHKLEGTGPIECYFQLVDGKATNFRAKFITNGKAYLGATTVRIQVGDERAVLSKGFFDWDRDIYVGGVKESCDVSASPELFAFLRIPAGVRSGTFRFESDNEARDVSVGPDEAVRIRQMVMAFRAYGGVVPE